MRMNRLFSLIMVIGALAVMIGLVSTSAGTAATQSAPVDEALSLNRHDPRSEVASQVAAASAAGRVGSPGDTTLLASPQQGRRPAGIRLDQRTRDAIRARWLARYGGTNRTCMLLCGGW